MKFMLALSLAACADVLRLEADLMSKAARWVIK